MKLTTQKANPALITKRLKDFAASFDARFEQHLSLADDVPTELRDAVRYSALAPGKRLRPYLVVRCCELVGQEAETVWPVAAAVECVHAFSLIHDDLPAMDDDDLRRGQPSCHKKFGEATAILAGDALVVLAFELLTRCPAEGAIISQLVCELASAAGWSGMIGGQTADVLGQSKPPNRDLVEYIHQRKTSRLFESACRLGAIAGRAGSDKVTQLGRYGQMMGRAFQIADDLLDVESTASTLGKGVGKDARAGKQTFRQCVGIEGSDIAAAQAVESAIAALDTFGGEADDLKALARYAVDRNY